MAAGFDLVPLDGGGRISLPEGETVLGRGPLLGVSDKRVSRQHGLLKNQNGCLWLKSIHVNPCFTLLDGNLARPQPLERECWHTLCDGEVFSLLPGSLAYRVEAVGGASLTPRNSGAPEEAVDAAVGSRASPEHDDTPPPCGIGQQQTPPSTTQTPPPPPTNHAAALTDRTPPAVCSPECEAPPTQEATPTPTRGPIPKLQQNMEQSGRGFLPKPKRVLPAWMTSSAAQAGQSGAGRKQPLPAADKTKRARTHLPRAGLSSEETRAGLSSEETRAGLSTEETRAGLSSEETRSGLSSEETRAGLSTEETRTGLSSEETRAGLSAELPRAGLSAEEDHGDEGSSDSAPRRKRRKRRKMSGDENVRSETREAPSPRNHSNSPGEEECGRPSDEGAPGSDIRPDGTSTAPVRAGSASGHAPSQSARPRCPYGEACYRKNPLHFQECSHPGDHDYQQEEEEPEQEVDLPECPYGIDCYRKNPVHRKEYKHSRRPARATRTAPRAHAGDEDGGDDADSFINDSSDDAYDDSDYVPAGSDDSGQEDIQTLQADAKDFLKRRK